MESSCEYIYLILIMAMGRHNLCNYKSTLFSLKKKPKKFVLKDRSHPMAKTLKRNMAWKETRCS